MSSPNVHHEPLIRIAKRDGIPVWKNWLIRLISVVIALLLSGLFIFAVTKLNPIKVYVAMFEGALGTKRRVWITVRDTMMLLCIGVGLAPAFKTAGMTPQTAPATMLARAMTRSITGVDMAPDWPR